MDLLSHCILLCFGTNILGVDKMLPSQSDPSPQEQDSGKKQQISTIPPAKGLVKEILSGTNHPFSSLGGQTGPCRACWSLVVVTQWDDGLGNHVETPFHWYFIHFIFYVLLQPTGVSVPPCP